MPKKNKQNEATKEKVMTKYDRKMQARKEKAEQDKKDNFRSRLYGILIPAVLILAVGIAIFVTVNNQRKAVSEVYMTVGDHEITRVEYDFYYHMMMTEYVSSYSSLLPYMGYDATVDPDLQEYNESMTWGDFFDQIAVNQITDTKAMLDDAKSAGYVYENEDADYQAFVDGFALQAEQSQLSFDDYLKSCFGLYATQERLEPFVRESMYVSGYANKLKEDFAPTDEEVASYYEENKNNYDTITYKVYSFVADTTGEKTEEELEAAMTEMEVKANEMKESCLAGEDFQTLGHAYDLEAAKANGDEEELETSEDDYIISGVTYNSMSTLYADWMYDEARVANDVEVFEDSKNNRYYVVQFVEKVYEETTNETIFSKLASEKVVDYKNDLADKYEVLDVAGYLNHLNIPNAENAK